MRQVFVLIVIASGIVGLYSCTRHYDLASGGPSSSVTVVHATVGAPAVVPDFNDSSVQWIASAQTISFGSAAEYGLNSGMTPIEIVETPDSTQMLFSGTLSLAPQGIYTLFLAGINNGQNQADTLFTRDSVPYYPVTDSVMGVRFVNLSPGSLPVSIDIQGNGPGSEVSSLGYRAITGFKAYPATSEVSGITFEIRDAASGTLLTIAVPSIITFKSITIALIGVNSPTTTSPLSTMVINNY